LKETFQRLNRTVAQITLFPQLIQTRYFWLEQEIARLNVSVHMKVIKSKIIPNKALHRIGVKLSTSPLNFGFGGLISGSRHVIAEIPLLRR
jgi:hypothetical protein